MHLYNTMFEKEAKVLAALCYGYQNMDKPMFQEGGTRRPWTPLEIMTKSLTRLRNDYKMTMRELTVGDAGEFKPKGQRIDARGNIVPHADVPPEEKAKANKIMKAILEWDEEVMDKCGKDKDVAKIMQTLGIPMTSPEKRVKMDIEVVQRGSDVMSLMDASEEELAEKAKELDEANKSKVVGPATREEYDKQMAEMLASVERKLANVDKRSKEGKELLKEKQDILDAIDKTNELAASTPLVQSPQPLVSA